MRTLTADPLAILLLARPAPPLLDAFQQALPHSFPTLLPFLLNTISLLLVCNPHCFVRVVFLGRDLLEARRPFERERVEAKHVRRRCFGACRELHRRVLQRGYRFCMLSSAVNRYQLSDCECGRGE